MLLFTALLLQAGPGMGQPAAAPAATASAPAKPASAQRDARPRAYQPPITVPSAGRIELQPVVPPAVAAPLPRPPVFTSGCDSAGCWGSDGTRYNASGGVLLRPDGALCSNAAGVLQCP